MPNPDHEPRDAALSLEAREALGKIVREEDVRGDELLVPRFEDCNEAVRERCCRIGLAVRAHVLAELAGSGPLSEHERKIIKDRWHFRSGRLADQERRELARDAQDDIARVLNAYDIVLADQAALRAELEAERGRAERAERERDGAAERARHAEWERSEAMKAGTPFWAERDSANALILERDQLRAALAAAERKAAEMERAAQESAQPGTVTIDHAANKKDRQRILMVATECIPDLTRGFSSEEFRRRWNERFGTDLSIESAIYKLSGCCRGGGLKLDRRGFWYLDCGRPAAPPTPQPADWPIPEEARDKQAEREGADAPESRPTATATATIPPGVKVTDVTLGGAWAAGTDLTKKISIGIVPDTSEYEAAIKKIKEVAKDVRALTVRDSTARLSFDAYQAAAAELAIYPNAGQGVLPYPILGLVGEAGEIANKYKKVIRDDGGVLSPAARLALAKELGDVLWYVAAVATELAFPLADVAAMNLEKLTARRASGSLGGQGDDR